MLLSAQVHVMLWYLDARQRLRDMARDERGDAYTSTIMIAIGVVIAITVDRSRPLIGRQCHDGSSSRAVTTPSAARPRRAS
jgi:hypothetical protein